MTKLTLFSLLLATLPACTPSTTGTKAEAIAAAAREKSPVQLEIARNFRADAGLPSSRLEIEIAEEQEVSIHDLARGAGITRDNIQKNFDQLVTDNKLITLGQSHVYTKNMESIMSDLARSAQEIKADFILYVAKAQSADGSTEHKQVIIMFCTQEANISEASLKTIEHHRMNKLRERWDRAKRP